ncbi:MAG: hypothetical protein MI920_11130, partial [Kiloniellales bacterium]|nr:hypothetical protein [Kiloniellales bacterium]
GAGAAPGVDSDCGTIAAWLQSRELPGIEIVARALGERIEHGEDPTLVWQDEAAPARRASLGGRSLLLLSGALVDLVAAQARREPVVSSVLEIHDARAPLTLLAMAASLSGVSMTLRWGRTLSEITAAGQIEAPGHVTLFGETWQPVEDAGTVCLSIEGCTERPSKPSSLPPLLASGALAERHQRAIDLGLEVPDEPWHRLEQLAARTLVPATEESRVRGAGAQVSDNE